jgi:hypothetical protein
MSKQPKIVFLRAYVKKENGHWIAVCIDLNIVGEGTTPEQAKQECTELIIEYVDYVFSAHRNQIEKYIPRLAPDEFINEYYQVLTRELASKKAIKNRHLYNIPIERETLAACHA